MLLMLFHYTVVIIVAVIGFATGVVKELIRWSIFSRRSMHILMYFCPFFRQSILNSLKYCRFVSQDLRIYWFSAWTQVSYHEKEQKGNQSCRQHGKLLMGWDVQKFEYDSTVSRERKVGRTGKEVFPLSYAGTVCSCKFFGFIVLIQNAALATALRG